MNDTTTLTNQLERILAGSIPLQTPALPDVRKFCTILPLDDVAPGAKANIPVVSAVQAVQENPASFENSGDTVDLAQVTPVHLSGQFGFSAPENASGMDLRMLLQSHLTKLQSAILAKIYAVLTTANYGVADTVSSAAWAEANLQAMLTAVPNRTALVLETAYWSKVRSDWLPPGSEAVLAECSTWTGAEANVVGFAARPEAIALGVGYPLAGPGDGLQTRKISLPIGLDVQMSHWFQRHGRAWRASLDIILAPEVGQSGALRLLKSA